MTRPPYGLYLPCRYRRCRDADTIEISFPSSERVYAIRLIDCYAPELSTPEGRLAKAFAEEVLDEAADELSVWIPLPKGSNLLRQLLSFDRLLGHVLVGTEDSLAQMLVAAGHATVEKSS